MAVPSSVTITLAAASANNICLSQTPGGAGALTIAGSAATGGVATLDVARRVLITPAANETGHNFVVTGTDRNGNAQSETLAGANAVAFGTVLDYKTVTSVTISAAATGALTVGTSSVGSSNWLQVNANIAPVNIGIGVVVTGTINFTVEYTYDNPNTIGSGITVWSITALATKSANTDTPTALTGPVRYYRITVNSGTGSATMTGIQAGVSNA